MQYKDCFVRMDNDAKIMIMHHFRDKGATFSIRWQTYNEDPNNNPAHAYEIPVIVFHNTGMTPDEFHEFLREQKLSYEDIRDIQ